MSKDVRTERFYRLIWPHAPTVLRTARILIRNAAEADDLAQDTMMKAFRAIDQLREGTDARSWLLTILRNTCTDLLRSQQAHAGEVSLDAIEHDPADVEPSSASDESVWRSPEKLLDSFSDGEVITALQTLPEEIRWTLLLADVEGLAHADAAAILEVPVGTVKSRVSRGRTMLRAALAPLAKHTRLRDARRTD